MKVNSILKYDIIEQIAHNWATKRSVDKPAMEIFHIYISNDP